MFFGSLAQPDRLSVLIASKKAEMIEVVLVNFMDLCLRPVPAFTHGLDPKARLWQILSCVKKFKIILYFDPTSYYSEKYL